MDVNTRSLFDLWCGKHLGQGGELDQMDLIETRLHGTEMSTHPSTILTSELMEGTSTGYSLPSLHELHHHPKMKSSSPNGNTTTANTAIQELKEWRGGFPQHISSRKLLSIYPQEIKFPFELNKKVSCYLQLPNNTDDYVAFMVMGTGTRTYSSTPNCGVISPHSICHVWLTMQPQKEAPPDLLCDDFFDVLSTVVRAGTTQEDINSKMFDRESGKVVEECTFTVAFVPPPPKLLSIETCKIEFPFELKKQISQSIVLPNKTDNYVAFKVMVTDKLKYCVRPNFGVISPQSTCDVTLTMKAMGEAPPNMECKDKFLIQSTVVSDGAILEDVIKQKFHKESGNLIEKHKLRVVLVSPPEPPLAVQEKTEELISKLIKEKNSALDQPPLVVPEKTEEIISKLIKEKNSALEQANMLRGKLELLSQERHGSCSCIVCRIRSKWSSSKSWGNKETKID